MAFTFYIPSIIDELSVPVEQGDSALTIYRVHQTYNAAQLESLVAAADEQFRRLGPKFIFESFDTFFWIIKHFTDISPAVRDKAWSLLSNALIRLQKDLVEFFENFQMNHRKEYLNQLLMLMYPFILICKWFEGDEDTLVTIPDPIDASSGGKAKKKKATSFKSQTYQNHKFKMTNTILRIITLSLERLFDRQEIKNQLSDVISSLMFKILDNGNFNRATTQQNVFQDVCEILGVLSDKFGFKFYNSLLLFIQVKESNALVAAAVVSNNIKNGHNIFIHQILDSMKTLEFVMDNLTARTTGIFLVEIGKSCPASMFQNLSALVDFLEHDSYPIRNAVFKIICNLILSMFANPTKNRDIKIKNKLLDILFDHIHDSNSYSRSKVLQLWSKLAESDVIPIARLNDIAERIIGRLDDRVCYVRKNAVHFLTQTLKDNSFSILSKNDLAKCKAKYKHAFDRHKAKLEQIKDRHFKQLDEVMKLSGASDEQADDSSNTSSESNKENEGEPETSRVPKENKRKSGEPIVDAIAAKRQKMAEEIQELATQWIGLEKQFIDFWRRTGSTLDLTDSIPDDIPQESIAEAFVFFRTLVRQREFEKALRVLISLKTMYPNEKLFEFRNRQATNESEDRCEDDDDSQSQPMDALFDMNDHLFLSAITNFSTDFSKKLPYELDLARLVFLAPLIDFGNAAIEAGELEGPNKKNDNCLKDFLAKHSEELESDQTNMELLEKFLASMENVLLRINEAERYVDMISDAVPKICQLLQSKNIADVQEAIIFFRFAFKLDLDNAMIGVQRMLRLIFTKEKAIKDKLMEAFSEIYLNESEQARDEEQDDENEEDDEEEMPNSKSVAFREIRNLTNMILNLNQGELVCAEALVQEIYHSKKFTTMHLQVLWERYAMKLSRTNEDEARGALIIIGMLASAQPNLIQNEHNLANLVQISLEARCNDYRLVAETCQVLIRSFKLPNADTGEFFFKLPQTHQLFVRMEHILIDSITNTDNKYWDLMSRGIIKVIYFFAEKPDAIITRIVETIYRRMIHLANNSNSGTEFNDLSGLCSQKASLEAFPSQLASNNEMPSSQVSTQPAGYIDDVIVARFLSILGDVAINLLIHLDFHLMKEIKIRQFIKDKESQNKKDIQKQKEKKEKEQKEKEKKKKERRQTVGSKTQKFDLEDDDEMNEIIGPTSNEDPFQEMVTRTCNHDVLFKHGILFKFKGLVERYAKDYEGQQFSFVVRLSASLAMAKLMVLSLQYTRENRAVLASLLDRSKDWEIRSNAIISFGDLLVRFPNEFEHISGKIFVCLNDSSFAVRSNALKVLTRLILADMIKPKGHISKIAHLITDANDNIRDMARLFFIELGKKNNVYIYNFLPDIISNLSGSKGMGEAQFHEMIKFLFELLEKTRNTESLVTKLCLRFRDSHDERTLRDLSFCLSQLQFNDRAIINLHNNMNHFIETVCYDAIHDNVMSIFANAKKASLKPDTKTCIEEMENKIKEIRAKGIEQYQQQQNAEGQEGGEAGDEVAMDAEQQQQQNETSDSERMPPPELPQADKQASRRGRPAKKPLFDESMDSAATTSRSRRVAPAKVAKESSKQSEDSFVSSRSSRSSSRSTRSKVLQPKVENTRSTRGRRKVVVEEESDEDADDTYDFDNDQD